MSNPHKHLLPCLLASLSLCACCHEEADGPQPSEGVTLTIKIPVDASRAPSGAGTLATDLLYAVYNPELDGPGPLIVGHTTMVDNACRVQLELGINSSYKIVFWAQSPDNEAYTFDPSGAAIDIDYDKVGDYSDLWDAFTQQVDVTVSDEGIEREVVLRRPFAQLNIGTSDLWVVNLMGLSDEFTRTKVRVKGAMTRYNLATQEATGKSDAEFGLFDRPTGVDFPIAGYDYMSMVYVLVPEETLLAEIAFGVDDPMTPDKVFSNVPLRRNYRTNLYGELFSKSIGFHVTVSPWFEEPDNDYPTEIYPPGVETGAYATENY